MVRNNGEQPFDPDERRELRRIVPRVPEIVDHLDTRLFWRRAYKLLKRTLAIVTAVAAGLSAMGGAVLVFKEFIKRVVQ